MIFKQAIRGIKKAKALSFIHIGGLAIAIAAATLLFMTVMFEFSYDSFHQDKERIGIIYSQSEPSKGLKRNTSMSVPMGPALKAEIPNIEALSRIGNGHILLRKGEKEIEVSTKYVDFDFLNMLSFKLLQGSKQALANLDEIVLDQKTAENLFGSMDVVGKQVEANNNGTWEEKTIAAVVENSPKNSGLKFNSLLRFEKLPNYQENKDAWDNLNHEVVVKLKSASIDDHAFSNEVQPFMNKYFAQVIERLKRDGARADARGNFLTLHIVPIADFHLHPINIGSEAMAKLPYILLGIAGLILFIACSNFVNLSLANSISRMREIGTRKTLGGSVWQIFKLLWTESFLLCVLALIIGVFITWIIIPEYNATMRQNLSILQLVQPINLLAFLLTFALISLLAGGYPALKIAKTNIIQSIKGAKTAKASLLRSSLTVIQFVVAIVLIISSVVIASQLHFLTTTSLGYNKSEVISIPMGKSIDHRLALSRMRQELGKYPFVQAITATDINLGRGNDEQTRRSQFGFDHENKEYQTNFMSVDFDYIKTLEVKLLAGRDFDSKLATDSSAVIINKALAEQLGGVDQVIGKVLNLEWQPVIIGVMDDFNFQDLKSRVEPLTISPNSIFSVDYLFIRVKSDNLAQSLEQVESVWKKINPNANIAASYLDENTENQYRAEKVFSKIILSGSVIAISISCLGLFALALMIINSRMKEIGIRKVLGSSISGIVFLLSKDFLKLVVIAFAIGAPIAYWLMNTWLQSYVYRTHIQFWMFGLTAFLIFAIAASTIAWQTIRAAKTNPVNSLKEE